MNLLLLLLAMLPSCAVLHHIQIGDVDARMRSRPFEIKVSETGIDLGEATRIGQQFTRNGKAREQMQAVNDIISLFQMGPRTGNLVYNDSYAEGILLRLYQTCPNGRITGLASIRESRKYPVISGEIVKITGYCIAKGK